MVDGIVIYICFFLIIKYCHRYHGISWYISFNW